MDSEQKDNITMEQNEKITDELIAKYISGKTTEEEDRIIHDYHAHHPEFANDLLDIATALRRQRKHDEATRQVDQKQPQEAQQVPLIRRRTFYAIAASVAALIVFGLLFFKPFAQNDSEQTLADADTEITNNSPSNNGEGNDLNPTDITAVDLQSEEVLLADNQEPAGQTTENHSDLQPDQPLLADNTNPQQQSDESEAPIMASMTVNEDNSNAPSLENAVFSTDIPTACNPDSALVLKWSCNAPKLVIEISYGEGKLWEKTYNNSINQMTLGSRRLDGFRIYSPQGFNWKMTAYYRDGTRSEEGFVRFIK